MFANVERDDLYLEVCTLASSSSGNCALVSQGRTHILIDAGISLRRIKNSLSAVGLTVGELAGVLVTHGHSDHIGGIKMLVKYHRTRIYATEGAMHDICVSAPDAAEVFTVIRAGEEFEIGGIGVKSFNTPHDAPDSVGFRLTCGRSRLMLATDLGSVTQEVKDAALGADVAIIEANHDVEMLKNGSYPYYLKKRVLSKKGHLSNADCGGLAAALVSAGARQLVLAHLSRENNTPGLALATVESELRQNGIETGRDVELDVAHPDIMGRRYII